MFAWRDNRWMGPLRGQKNGRLCSFFEQNRPFQVLCIAKYRLMPLLPLKPGAEMPKRGRYWFPVRSESA